MKKSVLIALSSFSLFVLGMVFGKGILAYCLDMLATDKITFYFTEVAGQFSMALVFALALGVLPLLIALVHRFSHVSDKKAKLISALIVILAGFVYLIYRMWRIADLVDYMSPAGADYEASLRVPPLGAYLLIGFIIGTVLSLIIFRIIKSRAEA